MRWSRREAVKALAAGVTASPAWRRRPSTDVYRRGAESSPGSRPEGGPDPAVVIDGAAVRTLAMRALDAAKAIGAEYADVRFTRQLTQDLRLGVLYRFEQRGDWYPRLDGVAERVGVGVRARVGGGWGFAASPYWDPEDVVRLAQEAARQAKGNARVSTPWTAWTPIPAAVGHWATPGVVDPFVVPVEEKLDALGAWLSAGWRYRRYPLTDARAAASFVREERALATSEGCYCTQTCYVSEGMYEFSRHTMRMAGNGWQTASARGLARTAAGWELFTQADIPGQLPRLFDEADPSRLPPPVKSGDVGRYDVVFDAQSIGALLERTLGPATQLDRALGLEANAGGTSYLGPDPLALLGNFQAASPLVTVTANRSLPQGLATVQWDDEGVEPADFPLVKDGVLVDYQTTRDQAPLLAPYYQQASRPVRSHGCAGAETATGVTLQRMPNLVLEPGKADVSFEALVADTKKGLAVMGAEIVTDFQGRTGRGSGQLREISNGTLGPVVEGLAFTFNATKLWKSVMALGGATSAVQYAARQVKGQPAQQAEYSIRAVPAAVPAVDFVDPTRRG